ncbi:MAG: hypothetical protein OYG31_02215, partial [Candidatus Kaiserbacteria bacterium]|nr:hypothetical protein [Candidatus Kaiserbacteria bacterium]
MINTLFRRRHRKWMRWRLTSLLLISAVVGFCLVFFVFAASAQTALSGVRLLSNRATIPDGSSQVIGPSSNQYDYEQRFRTSAAGSAVLEDIILWQSAGTGNTILIDLYLANSDGVYDTNDALFRTSHTIDRTGTSTSITGSFNPVPLAADTEYAIIFSAQSTNTGDATLYLSDARAALRSQPGWHSTGVRRRSGSAAFQPFDDSRWFAMTLVGKAAYGIVLVEPDDTPQRRKRVYAFINIENPTFSKYVVLPPGAGDSDCNVDDYNNSAFSNTNFPYYSSDAYFAWERHNGKRVCYIASDGMNPVRALSKPIVGLDTTPPVIATPTIPTRPHGPSGISLGFMTVSATDSNTREDNEVTIQYAWVTRQSDNSLPCDASTVQSLTHSVYTESGVVLRSGDVGGHYCFWAQDTAGNVSYKGSSRIQESDIADIVVTGDPQGTGPEQSKTVTITISRPNDLASFGSFGSRWTLTSSQSTCPLVVNNEQITSFIPSETGAQVTLTDESNNGMFLCAKAVKRSGNLFVEIYGSSLNAIGGIDTTAPVITVSGPLNTAPGRRKVLSAVDDDTDTTWSYVSISRNQTCNDADFTSPNPYTEGNSIVISDPAENNTRICFRSVDAVGNVGYGLSELIAGIDDTLGSSGTLVPTITITGPADTNPAMQKTFTATDNYATATTLVYLPIAHDRTCNNATDYLRGLLALPLGEEPVTYTEGSEIVLNEERYNNKKLCFRSTDEITYGFGTSALINGIDTTPPVITTGGLEDTERARQKIVSATDGETTSTFELVFVDGAKTKCFAADFINDGVVHDYTEGADFTLRNERFNDKKTCFRSRDAAGNYGYALSNLIGGIDDTSPVVTVSGPVTTDAASAKTTFATDDDAGVTTWRYQQVSNAQSKTECSISDFTDASPVYKEGEIIFLSLETDNNSKVCFESTDSVGLEGYGISALINGIDEDSAIDDPDNDPLIITINNPEDTDPAMQKTLTATDNYATATAFVYLPIAHNRTCDNATDFIQGVVALRGESPVSYTEGNEIILNEERYNNRKLCFRSTSGNVHEYGTSALINGIDATAPIITVTSPDTDPENMKTVLATDDDPGTTTWYYDIVAHDGDCSSADFTSERQYTEGQNIRLTSESNNNQKVCFKSVDAVGNEGYGASSVINGIDTTPPIIRTLSPQNTDPARSKIFFAYDSDAAGTTTWKYVIVPGTRRNCRAGIFNNKNLDTRPYAEGYGISLVDEEYNGSKICFQSMDSAGNKGHAFSAVIGGIDEDASSGGSRSPSVFVTGPVYGPARVKTVFATDSYVTPTTMHYDIIPSAQSCLQAVFDDSNIYTEGEVLTFDKESDNGTIICFRSTDEVGNFGLAITNPINEIDRTAPTVTVTNPNTNPERFKTISAADDDSAATTWVYK